MTKQVANAIGTDGEVLNRFRDRDPDNVFDRMATKMSGVGVQLQLMEIDHLVLGRNWVEENGTVTVEGENRSQYNGQILGYFLYRRHPEILVSVPMSGPNLPVWVPAVDVLRVSHVDRIGAQRMMPPMKPILSTMRNRQDYVDAEIIRKGVAARRTYIIKSPGLANDKEVLQQMMGGYSGASVDGQSPEGEFVISMPENGEALSLPPGWDFQVTDPADVGEGFAPFMKMIGQEIAAGTGQPYVQVSMDAEGLNDRMARWLDIQTERDIGFDQEEYLVRQFLRPVWQRWLARAFYVDGVFSDKDYDFEALLRIGFSYPKRDQVNRYQQAQTDQIKLTIGTTSQARLIEAQGEDPTAVAMENALYAAMQRQLAPGSAFAKKLDSQALERLEAQLALLAGVTVSSR
jgi:capsid protein